MDATRVPATTTDSGIPAESDEYSLTVGRAGPTVLHDHYLVQKMQHFNRERVPERVVHAKGSGAHGFFEVTEDVTWFTRASFLARVAKRTPVFARFSTVAGEQGSADTVRDPRGFALKFYTDEGNFDLVGNNTPVFFVRDATKFQDFIHSQKRLPDTGMRSNDMQWDFWTLSPESAHQVAVLMSDRGTPLSYRTMNGYGSHTYSTVNAKGERFWVKYHFKTVQGVQNFTDAEAKAMTAEDPDFHRRDLFDAISAGDAPEWRLEMQVMPFEEAADYRFNPFDLTKVWPHADYAPVQVGRLVLDRNPSNFFAEVEQAASRPPTSFPAPVSALTACSWAASSRTTTRTCIGSARTTNSCRSMRRRSRSTPTTRTPPWLTATPGRSPSTPRTPTAGQRRIRRRRAPSPGRWSQPSSSEPPTRSTRRTTTSARPARCTGTS